jgi:hypothetical protein
MTQTLAGTIAGPITLSDPNATILPGSAVYWYHPYGGHAIVAPVGVNSTLVNSGDVLAIFGYGIDVGAGLFVNQSAGAVVASDGGVYNFANGGPLTVVNQGLIAGSISGVILQHQGLVANAAHANIGGAVVGIRLAGADTVTNAGTIASYTIGVQGVTGDAITNSLGGEIDGGVYGITGVSLLDNGGFVTATGATGIAAAATAIINTGTIRSATALVAATLDNTGIVDGTGLGALAATVTNAGEILSGPGGTALRLSAAGRLVLEPAFAFTGAVDGGSTVTSVLELAGTAAAATYLGALGTTIVDFGSVTVDAGANWILGPLDSLAPGERLTVAGTLESGAAIAAGANSVAVAGGTLANTGTIVATGTAVDVAAAYVANSGTIATTGTLAVHLAGGATFANTGFIAADGDAILVAAGTPALVELAGNPASVTGTVDGGNPIGGAVVSTLVLSGPFATLAGLGTHYVDFGLVELSSPITASGANTVAAGQRLTGPRLVTTGSFTNAGTLTAGLYVASGTLFNDATIDGSIAGIQALAGAGTIVNAGTVRGHGDVGIILGAGATLANQASGLVAADTSLFGAGSTLASFAVQLTNGGLVTNAGTLAARYGVIGSGTVIDTGTILATGGTAVSFQDALGASRLVVDPGAVFVGGLDGGATAAGLAASLEFAPGSFTLAGFGVSISHFTAITLDPGAHWLLAGTPQGFAAQPLEGLAGSTLELTGTVESGAGLSGGYLTLSGGPTLDLPGIGFARVTNDGSNTFIAACFASGTSIATARGQVAIEHLAIGDRVLTASGRLAPIIWLGRRKLDPRRHPRPHDVMPVRIHAGAFGSNVPSRDLILSPDHAVLMDGSLVPIRHLINGASIVQEPRATITYWHLELAHHDAVLAEGLACETYLDTGNRAAFEGHTQALHPDFAQHHARAIWEARGCAPILTDPTAPALRVRHLRVLARAKAQARKSGSGA